MELEQIEGTVEDIIYENPDNGYTVFEISGGGTVTVVLDASLRGRTVGVHPLENTATTFLNLDDLAALLEDHGVPVIWCPL